MPVKFNYNDAKAIIYLLRDHIAHDDETNSDYLDNLFIKLDQKTGGFSLQSYSREVIFSILNQLEVIQTKQMNESDIEVNIQKNPRSKKHEIKINSTLLTSLQVPNTEITPTINKLARDIYRDYQNTIQEDALLDTQIGPILTKAILESKKIENLSKTTPNNTISQFDNYHSDNAELFNAWMQNAGDRFHSEWAMTNASKFHSESLWKSGEPWNKEIVKYSLDSLIDEIYLYTASNADQRNLLKQQNLDPEQVNNLKNNAAYTNILKDPYILLLALEYLEQKLFLEKKTNFTKLKENLSSPLAHAYGQREKIGFDSLKMLFDQIYKHVNELKSNNENSYFNKAKSNMFHDPKKTQEYLIHVHRIKSNEYQLSAQNLTPRKKR